jgi:hypothetical protein
MRGVSRLGDSPRRPTRRRREDLPPFISHDQFNRTPQDRADLLMGVSVEGDARARFPLKENHGHLLPVDHPHLHAGTRHSWSHVIENKVVHEAFTVVRSPLKLQ